MERLKKAAYPAEIGFEELKQQRRYATMSKDNVVSLPSPEGVEDPLTELLRAGAKRLIQQAIEAELAELPAQYGE